MALTTGAKRFLTLVVISAIAGAGIWQGQLHNWWGVLDKKAAPVQTEAEQETQAPQSSQPVVVIQTQPAQSTQEDNSTQQAQQVSPKHNETINRLKDLDKL